MSTDTKYNSKLIKTELEKMLEKCSIIDATVVVTIDGHMVEQAETRSYPLKRIGTMGSSMISLGDTMTSELKMGNCRNIIAENEQGILTMMHINDELVLVTITHDKKSLGMLLSSSRLCADAIRTAL